MENLTLIKVIDNSFLCIDKSQINKILVFDYEIDNNNNFELKESMNAKICEEIEKCNLFLEKRKLNSEKYSKCFNFIFDIHVYKKEYIYLLKNIEIYNDGHFETVDIYLIQNLKLNKEEIINNKKFCLYHDHNAWLGDFSLQENIYSETRKYYFDDSMFITDEYKYECNQREYSQIDFYSLDMIKECDTDYNKCIIETYQFPDDTSILKDLIFQKIYKISENNYYLIFNDEKNLYVKQYVKNNNWNYYISVLKITHFSDNTIYYHASLYFEKYDIIVIVYGQNNIDFLGKSMYVIYDIKNEKRLDCEFKEGSIWNIQKLNEDEKKIVIQYHNEINDKVCNNIKIIDIKIPYDVKICYDIFFH